MKQETALLVTVDLAGNAALSEEQSVLCKRPRFITQQVSHLAQLLVQRGVPGLCRSVSRLPVQLQVPADEAAVDGVDHLEPADTKQTCMCAPPS